MGRSVSSDELLRRAREAAGMRNVREAIRDITLHALRSRSLTVAHVATVARTVGEGIQSSEVARTVPVCNTRREAWKGLEEALGRALHAIELAARQYAEGHGSIAPAEREHALAEISEMERCLVEGWEDPRAVPASLRTRIKSLSALLSRAEAVGAPPPVAAAGASVAGEAISLAASDALRRLADLPDDPAKGAAH